MLPRKMNGVVDPNLRVYGTANLRIADLSIVPLHVAAHTQCRQTLFFKEGLLMGYSLAVVYAVAQQAADIVLGNH